MHPLRVVPIVSEATGGEVTAAVDKASQLEIGFEHPKVRVVIESNEEKCQTPAETETPDRQAPPDSDSRTHEDTDHLRNRRSSDCARTSGLSHLVRDRGYHSSSQHDPGDIELLADSGHPTGQG